DEMLDADLDRPGAGEFLREFEVRCHRRMPNRYVMAGLVPAIHALLRQRKTWMAGTRPAMTSRRPRPQPRSHVRFPSNDPALQLVQQEADGKADQRDHE